MTSSWSDHSRIVRHINVVQLFSANFSSILECYFAWQVQYLVTLEDAS